MATKRRLLTHERVWDLNMLRNDLLTFTKMIADCKANDTAHQRQILENLLTLLPTYADTIEDVLYGTKEKPDA